MKKRLEGKSKKAKKYKGSEVVMIALIKQEDKTFKDTIMKQFGKDNGAGGPSVNTAPNGPGGPKTSR